ncbi:hypothetical protein QUA50_14845, partial [Microcoleus sp. M2_D5]|uniref:hypothetical protein n=1 Tax=Microcoleus sp. M2_D5 TaxID=3055376 RepID=UPI002FCFA4CA
QDACSTNKIQSSFTNVRNRQDACSTNKIQSSFTNVRNRQDACSTKNFNVIVERASRPFLKMV